jgi:geranylgeranyl diphosphate synthase type I
MSLEFYSLPLLSAIETELQRQVARLNEPHTQSFHEMLTYHLGWTGKDAGPIAQGKRIRPLLLLLTIASCKADWKSALPAAAAVELVHNFSLVHDDIQDSSDKRRGRETIWRKWGMPQGINAGDALFVLSNEAILDLPHTYPDQTVLRVAKILFDTCLDLTRGQYMDMSFELRSNLLMEDYWTMIDGKTAALLATCCEIGSLLGGVDHSHQAAYRSFGHFLGLAFQVQDDYLGIWGNSALTGKSVLSDLVSGKKSLPVLFGLAKKGQFSKRWADGPISTEEVTHWVDQLETEGARLFTQQTSDHLTELALQSLRLAEPEGDAGVALYELVNRLLNREA